MNVAYRQHQEEKDGVFSITKLLGSSLPTQDRDCVDRISRKVFESIFLLSLLTLLQIRRRAMVLKTSFWNLESARFA
jgi:hypothetical protein